MSINTKIVVIRRNADGLYYEAGCDAPDRWVQNPMDATDRSGLAYERDARYIYNNVQSFGMHEPEYSLCSFDVFVIPTEPLFQNGENHSDFKTSTNTIVQYVSKLTTTIQDLVDTVVEPPSPNCSCHKNPPCGDCVEYGGLREALANARALLKHATPAA
jgi:hypothetical protein